MALRTKVDLLDNAAVNLKVTVPKADVKEAYDRLVSDYSSKVSIKGFRKGKVPPAILIQKFGESLLGETAQKLVEKGLEQAFEKVEQKPLPYSIPELKTELKVELDKPFSFEVVFDTFPEVKVGSYKELEITEPVVAINKEDIDRELAGIQEQNSIVIDKADETVAKDDTVTIDYVELGDDGSEVEESRREGFTFTVGTGYNLYKIDDDIMGMKKGEERILEKEYPQDFEIGELAGRKVQLKVQVTSVKERNLPEIDDELAQDVSEKYETLDDMKADIRSRLEEAAAQRVRERNIDQLLTKIVADSEVPLPESMVRRELGYRWQEFVRQFRSEEKFVLQSLEQQGKTQEDLFDEWRPRVETAIMRRLVLERIAEEERIEVTDEEVDGEIAKEAESQNRPLEEVKSQFVEAQLIDYIRDSIRTRKIYDFLLGASRIKKGKKVKFLDILQGKD